VDERRDPTADEVERTDRLLGRMDALADQIEAELDKKQERLTPFYLMGGREGMGERSDYEVEDRIIPAEMSFRQYAVANRDRFGRMADPQFDNIKLGQFIRALISGPKNEAERRALTEGSDSAGGHTVPVITLANFIDALAARTVVFRSGARRVMLETDESKIARMASDPVAGWRSEGSTVCASDPTFEAVTFKPKSLAVLFKASRELWDDSLNIEAMVERAVGRSFAVQLDKGALVGSGSSVNQPLGLFGSTAVPSVSLDTTGGNGGAITSFNPFLDALEVLQGNNIDVPVSRLRAAMAPRTYRSVVGLRSTGGDGQPPQPPPAIRSLIEGGLEVTTSIPTNQAAGGSTEADASAIFMGDYSSMLIGVRSDLRLEILKERYADRLQFGILGYARYDVQHEHPESFVKITDVTTG
jgi:HK97 family phage major capsid protein